jgi:hypothetical protein
MEGDAFPYLWERVLRNYRAFGGPDRRRPYASAVRGLAPTKASHRMTMSSPK